MTLTLYNKMREVPALRSRTHLENGLEIWRWNNLTPANGTMNGGKHGMKKSAWTLYRKGVEKC